MNQHIRILVISGNNFLKKNSELCNKLSKTKISEIYDFKYFAEDKYLRKYHCV